MEIFVGIGDVKMAVSGEVLITRGLGSCVAVAIWDGKNRRGSLAHVMLPWKAFGKRREGENMNKYADVAIPAAVEDLERDGCGRGELTAKIAGGAHLFDLGREDHIDIGRRNIEAVRDMLARLGIHLAGEDTGGSKGRTVLFHVQSGAFVVRTLRAGERTL